MARKILHLLWSGTVGGIETLCLNIGKSQKDRHIFWLVHSGEQLYENMMAEGVDVKCLNMGNSDVIRLTNVLYAEYKKEKISAVIVHHDSCLLWLSSYFLKLKNSKVKVFIYTHANYTDMIGNDLIKKAIFKIAVKKADAVIAISNSVKKSFTENVHILKDKITVIYNGVNVEEFQNQIEFGKGKNIIYVGRLVAGKGVQFILQAIALLSREVHLDIVGDGPYRTELEKLVFKLKLEDKVIFHGFRDDVNRFLLDADIFVHIPTLNEGFGLTIVEAMAAGLICICSDSGGIPEIIQDSQTGFLIKKGQAEELAAVLEYVISHYDSEQIIAIRKAAQKKAQEFSMEHYMSALNNLSPIIGGGG